MTYALRLYLYVRPGGREGGPRLIAILLALCTLVSAGGARSRSHILPGGWGADFSLGYLQSRGLSSIIILCTPRRGEIRGRARLADATTRSGAERCAEALLGCSVISTKKATKRTSCHSKVP